MKKISIRNNCADFNSYRSARVKSLFNVESGANFSLDAELPVDDFDWKIGVVVGPSGSGKTSIGKKVFDGVEVHSSDIGWSSDRPIIDDISPDGDFDSVTGALSAVGLGSVPSWLRPYSVLSNGEKFRADLARILCGDEKEIVVDEFTSVIDRQIAKVGASAFSKAFKRTSGRRIVLLSCHYDVLEWIEPDWVFDTRTGQLDRGLLRRPKMELKIWETDYRYWHLFEPHYYLRLPRMVAAKYFVATINGELVAHLGVSPAFQNNGFRASRMVVMPEWQGAGVGMRFLNMVCQLHLDGHFWSGKKLPTYFHTSHPGLVSALRRDKSWRQVSKMTHGNNKKKSSESFKKSNVGGGFGGHFRAVQGFKYVGAK
jgi:energy-coupling factor transporter ATP-binding protein EcfA2